MSKVKATGSKNAKTYWKRKQHKTGASYVLHWVPSLYSYHLNAYISQINYLLPYDKNNVVKGIVLTQQTLLQDNSNYF